MTNYNPHKFNHNNAPSVHAVIIYCEYCGHVAFNGNACSQNEHYQVGAKLECPRSRPEMEKVVEGNRTIESRSLDSTVD